MTNCIILGAGIIGMSCARVLHQRGLEVTLLDTGTAGKQSSWAGGGILSPLHPWHYSPPVSALVQYSLDQYTRFIDGLYDETHIDAEYIKSGALFVDQDSIRQGQIWANQHQRAYQLLDQKNLREHTPAISDAYHDAIFFPDIYQVRTPRLLNALRASIARRKIPLFEKQQDISLVFQKNTLKGVKSRDRIFTAQKVIVATGAWTEQFLQHHQLTSPSIQPVRGQMILYTCAPMTLQHLLLDEKYYLIPRLDGRILAGSTTEAVGFNNAITTAAKQELEQAAQRLMPLLTKQSVEHHWSGLRPSSVNGIPSICQHPELSGLYINAGHFRNGVAMAPGSAALMADLMTGQAPAISPTPYQFPPQ